MRRLLSFALLLIAAISRASDGHGDGGATNVGPGRAVAEVSPKSGFRLTEPAARRLGVELADVGEGKTATVPGKSLVRHQSETGVYRYRRGWLKLVDVDVLSRAGGEARISLREFEAGDKLVIGGVALLRVVELDVAGDAEAGHHD